MYLLLKIVVFHWYILGKWIDPSAAGGLFLGGCVELKFLFFFGDPTTWPCFFTKIFSK